MLDSLIRRFTNKMARVLFRINAVYALAVKISSLGFKTLQDDSERARDILLSASPKPKELSHIEPRHWPIKPLYDISVIVPCYNVERFVSCCLESILCQETSYSFEVIAIDDGSKDKTSGILDKFAASDHRLRVIHQENRGLSGARNVGIANAQGARFVFVDSDDMLKPGALELLGSAHDDCGTDFVTASYDNISEDGLTVTPIVGKRNHGAPWGRIYSRDIWKKIDFPEGYWFEDTVQGFLIDPLFTHSYVNESVYLYRRNGEGITAKCSSSKRGLDSYWIIEYLIDCLSDLHISYNQAIHDKIIKQLGPILWWRCSALNNKEKKALFVCACELFVANSGEFRCSLGGRWNDLELALHNRNYQLWIIAVLGLS